MFNDDIHETLFFNLLRTGAGFSLSCIKSSLCIEKASVFYEEDKTFSKKVGEAIQLGLLELMTERDKILQEQENKYHFAEINEAIKSFISKVNLWACGLNEFQIEALEEEGYIYISSELILKGIALYGNLHETATAYAQTYEQMLDIVCSDPKLRYLAENKNGIKDGKNFR